ncbi:putative serine/threonine-protein kinase-like protein CCR3 [Lolium perenne]|uniref:putative serine/threonine-protein kinase-like protein CCR3 n=1 Tax=Lolium perenne TaxID=4522 RepID=UPI0021EB4D48|nr:putative serine/threonine-protein kinase-like protein CCR3 [Lolium perenne]
MTPLHTLHLAALLFLLLAAAASASTLAIAGGSTVCGVAADNGTVYCLDFAAATNSSASPIARPLVFSRVSGGDGYLCALGAGGGDPSVLLCWPPGPSAQYQLRRVYRGPTPYSDLSVGDDHVAAYDAQTRGIQWWRGGNSYPQFLPGAFTSLVSGHGFTCALEATNSPNVRCWGPNGSAVQSAFANTTSISSLAAGGTRACAVDSATGTVLCSGITGAGSAAPTGLYPHGLAVGDSHACGLSRPNHTAVCWTLAGPTPTVYYPAPGTAFEFLVAGANLTCGLVSANYTVVCWSATSADNAAVELSSLPSVLPGTCVPDASACDCDAFPGSGQICAAAGSPGSVICKRICEASAPPPAASPPQPPPAAAAPSKAVSKRWIAFAVVGAVGAFVGLCSIVYCLLFGFCSHKRIHNSVQPNLPGGAGAAPAPADTNVAAVAAASPYGSPNGSRARGFLFRRQLSRAMTRQRSGPSSFKDQTEEYTFAQLAAATEFFSPDAQIGAGSFGTVYRGKLPDGREVAIKRGESLARKFQEKESAFRSELAFLSRLHHKHLVGLVGYCEENDERLLVYEFMKNGALYDHLHPKPAHIIGDEPPLVSPVMSSWKLRIKILLDASRGIEYLHSYAVPPIIHRDIKSSNILLDGSWVARVSDFGLSLMGPSSPDSDDSAGAAVQQHVAMKAAGTVGYMDPEYYGMHHLTVKSDVYGFGVVMLETLTGKRALFRDAGGGGDPVSVVDYAQPSIVAGELGKVLDGRAPEPTPNEAEAVELVAYTAVHCVRLEGKDRPAMADIVANLETAFAFCEGSAGGNGSRDGRATGGGGYRNSSSSLSMTSMELSGRIGE